MQRLRRWQLRHRATAYQQQDRYDAVYFHKQASAKNYGRTSKIDQPGGPINV
jgi:hypothetical protein